MRAILQQIASIAKGLTKAELHDLIELAVRAEASGQSLTTASSRELAERTGLARASVQSAIDSLNHKLLIHSSAGKGSESALHVLTFGEDVAAESGGPTPRLLRGAKERRFRNRLALAWLWFCHWPWA